MVPFSVLDLSPIVEGGDARAVAAQHARPRAPRRALGLPPLLAGRAPQHAGHRQRRDVGGDRPRGGRHVDASASAPAASCCRTTRRWSSPSSSARSNRCIPGRIDLGSAARRASDQPPRARCGAASSTSADAFPQDVLELMALFRAHRAGQPVQAVPGAGLHGADLDPRLQPVRRAARRRARPAVRVRVAFRARPDDAGDGDLPRAIPALGAARRAVRDARRSTCSRRRPTRKRSCCSRSLQQAFVNLRSGRPGRLPPPVDGFDGSLAPARTRACSAQCSVVLRGRLAGDRAARACEAFVARTGADEMMVTSQIFDHAARLRSYELTAAFRKGSQEVEP